MGISRIKLKNGEQVTNPVSEGKLSWFQSSGTVDPWQGAVMAGRFGISAVTLELAVKTFLDLSWMEERWAGVVKSTFEKQPSLSHALEEE